MAFSLEALGSNRPAGIQYVGIAGASQWCVDAVVRMLQFHDRITHAKILTCEQSHALLLVVDEGDLVAVKAGFSSGYAGGGPMAFARALELLRHHLVEIDEFHVSRGVINRIDASALTEKDVEAIKASKPVRPMRWYDYIYDGRSESASIGSLWKGFRPVVPFAIMDPRIADLALRFPDEPNDCLLQGFRRLEDLVRGRTKLDEHGYKLFSQAFMNADAKLHWKGLQPGEVVGRANLFTGAFMAHRNPRAHKETDDGSHELLSEFLLLNHLFLLEAQATKRRGSPAKKKLAGGTSKLS